MDNAMVKRGIGAVVLAIIAALLLGYLLKDKSRERQEVVDIKLPNAPDMKIPSLGGAINKVSDNAATLVDNTKEKVADAGSSVVAAATGTTNLIKDSISNAKSTDKPGFAIRPPQPNETKEIIDTTAVVMEEELPIKVDTNKTPTKETVVASSANEQQKKPESNFKPQIVNKKSPEKSAKKAQKSTLVTNVVKTAKKEKAKSVAAASSTGIASKPLGKYSIQLLATSSQSRANKLAKTMQSEGYKVFITQTTRDNKILYRVRVGGHADRNSAIKAQAGMKKRYQKNFFVQNSLVISN